MIRLSRKSCFASLLLLVAFCGSAFSQQALVATAVRSASGQPDSVFLQRVDFGELEALPEIQELPGDAVAGPLLFFEGGRIAVAQTVSGRRSGANPYESWHYATFSSPPFPTASTLSFPNGWRQTCAALSSGDEQFLAVGGFDASIGTGSGMLYAFKRPDAIYATAADAMHAELPLPGVPVDLAQLPTPGWVAVLYLSQDQCAIGISVFDLGRRELVVELENFIDDTQQMSAEPASFAVSGDGETLYALVSGYSVGQRSGEAVSWLYAFETDTLESHGLPVELPGAAEPGDTALSPAGLQSCWVATRTRGTDFAHVSLVSPSPDGLICELQLPFVSVVESFLISSEPGGQHVAIAMDNMLQIRDETGAAIADWSFSKSLRVVRWTDAGILAGDAGRIHLLDARAPGAVASVQLAGGRVVDAAPVFDASWAHTSAAASNRLQAPHAVIFRGEAAGHEVKAMPVRSPGRWQIDYDREQMPWLVIHPTGGLSSTMVYMGIDPARYRPGSIESGVLHVRLAPNLSNLPRHDSEAVVELRLLPEKRFDVRRILWVWEDGAEGALRDDANPRGLNALAEMLAGPPHYLAHQEVVGNVQKPLDHYATVVLSASAAARGFVTRREIMDYVAGGGAVLLLGQHLPYAGERELGQWLMPVGIRIDTGTLVEGRFGAVGDHWLTRHWEGALIENGCAIYADDWETVRVPTDAADLGDACVLVTRTYGRGRIAALASKSPLKSDALDSMAGRLFAADLFHWLAGSDRHLEHQEIEVEHGFDGTGIHDYD